MIDGIVADAVMVSASRVRIVRRLNGNARQERCATGDT
jgi:hypothetical protein